MSPKRTAKSAPPCRDNKVRCRATSCRCLSAAQRPLVYRFVFGDMPGKDDVRPVADSQVIADFDAAFDQPVDFLQQRRRVQHDARRHDVQDARIQNAAGNMMQFVSLPFGDHRVSGVGPAQNRTTISFCAVSRSTNLPLASSPHCSPITQVPGTASLSIKREPPAAGYQERRPLWLTQTRYSKAGRVIGQAPGAS